MEKGAKERHWEKTSKEKTFGNKNLPQIFHGQYSQAGNGNSRSTLGRGLQKVRVGARSDGARQHLLSDVVVVAQRQRVSAQEPFGSIFLPFVFS